MYSKSDRVFGLANGFVLILISLSMFAPVIYLLAISLSSSKYVITDSVYLWPKGFNLQVYEQLIGMPELWRAMGISLFITVAGTLLALLLNASLAFALTRPQMKGRTVVTQGVLLTFILSIALIPGFLIVKQMGMLNTLWALIVPNATAAFYIIIMKSFFQSVSSELLDAAKADGCSEYRIFLQIVIPLSMPVIATIGLFHAVGQWNSYFHALIYLRDPELFPLQLILRNLVTTSGSQESVNNMSLEFAQNLTPEMLKAGVILFATFPIMIVYPFLQKHFVKGAMLGSLKE